MIEKLKKLFRCSNSETHSHIHNMKLFGCSELKHDGDLTKGGILYLVGWTAEQARNSMFLSVLEKGAPHLNIPAERFIVSPQTTKCTECLHMKIAYFIRLLPE